MGLQLGADRGPLASHPGPNTAGLLAGLHWAPTGKTRVPEPQQEEQPRGEHLPPIFWGARPRGNGEMGSPMDRWRRDRERWPRWVSARGGGGGMAGPALLHTRKKNGGQEQGSCHRAPRSRPVGGFIIDWQQAETPKQTISKLAAFAGDMKSKQG